MNNFMCCKLLGDQLEDMLAEWLLQNKDLFTDVATVRVVDTAGSYDIELVRWLPFACQVSPRELARAQTDCDAVRIDYGSQQLELITYVQVKYDVEYAKSGQIAVELAYRDVASGIQSKDAATWWMYGLGGTSLAFLIHRDEFRRFISSHRPKLHYLHGGDRDDSYMVLVPMALLREESSILLIDLPQKLCS